MTKKHSGMTVQLDELAEAVLLDVLSNVARMLESGVDPLQVAQQIRNVIASMEAQS